MRHDPVIATIMTDEEMMAAEIRAAHRPTREEIAAFAYHLYEVRGYQDGHDLDDWLSAELQLRRHLA